VQAFCGKRKERVTRGTKFPEERPVPYGVRAGTQLTLRLSPQPERFFGFE